MDLKRLIVLLVDLEAFVVPAAKRISDACFLNGIGTPVLELESALDVMLEFFEKIVERLSLSGAVFELRFVGVNASAVFLLRGS